MSRHLYRKPMSVRHLSTHTTGELEAMATQRGADLDAIRAEVAIRLEQLSTMRSDFSGIMTPAVTRVMDAEEARLRAIAPAWTPQQEAAEIWHRASDDRLGEDY